MTMKKHRENPLLTAWNPFGSLWEREFPGWKFEKGFEAELLPRLEDMSWHNDTMPSFCEPRAGLRVWVDHLVPSEREFPTNPHLYIVDALYWDGECWVDNYDPREGRAIFETNDVTELLAFLEGAPDGKKV